MTDTRELRLKRLKIRSWRRGTKEMDLLLGPFAEGPLRDADDTTLDRFEALLDENDNELYDWVSGVSEPKAEHVATVGLIKAFHKIG